MGHPAKNPSKCIEWKNSKNSDKHSICVWETSTHTLISWRINIRHDLLRWSRVAGDVPPIVAGEWPDKLKVKFPDTKLHRLLSIKLLIEESVSGRLASHWSKPPGNPRAGGFLSLALSPCRRVADDSTCPRGKLRGRDVSWRINGISRLAGGRLSALISSGNYEHDKTRSLGLSRGTTTSLTCSGVKTDGNVSLDVNAG